MEIYPKGSTHPSPTHAGAVADAAGGGEGEVNPPGGGMGRYVRNTVGKYVVPDITNIHNTLAIIGHRFGHQFGLERVQDDFRQCFGSKLDCASICVFQKR